MSAKHHTEGQCQYTNARGHRCRLLIDNTQRSPNGEGRSTLCPYHVNRSRANALALDPEILATELLAGIEDFSTARSVNLFLGNLVRQLARKRIARRDAVALAYIGQLILNSLPAMQREFEAEQDASAGQFLLDDLIRSRAASLAESDASESGARDLTPSVQS